MAKTLNDFIKDSKAGTKPVSASQNTGSGTAPGQSAGLRDYIELAKRNRGQASAPAGNPYTAALNQGRTDSNTAERDYLRAADAYKAALAEMQMTAQSGGMVSAELAQRVNQAQAEQAKYQQIYGQAAQDYEKKAYEQKLGDTRTDVSSYGELLRQQRTQAAENQIYAQSGDQAGQRRLAQEQQAVNEQLDALRTSLRAEGYSEAEIRSLEGYLTRAKNAEEMEKLIQVQREQAKESGSLGNLGISVGAGLLSGVGYLDLAAQNLLGREDAITGRRALVDYNTDAQALFRAGEATTQGEMDKLLEKYGVTDEDGNRDFTTEGKIRAGAYQLATSMGQSAAVAGLTALGAPAAMILLSGSAATAATHEMHEKGFSDGTALLMGGIAGAAEYVTEKIGMDALFKTRDLSTCKNLIGGLLRNITHQAMAEGGEEVLSTIINTLADVIVNGDRNELRRQYEALLSYGYTEAQAKEIAARQWLSGVWNDFYMGALSGALFGMGGTAFQGARNAATDTATGRQILSQNMKEDLIRRMNQVDVATQTAANMPGIEELTSARKVGAADRALGRAQAMQNMRAELAQRGEENVSDALLSGLYASSQQQEQRLTREERRALRGSEAAQELARAWREQWNDDSIPAPFEGMPEYVLGAQIAEQKKARERAENKQTEQSTQGQTTRGRTAEERAAAEQRIYQREQDAVERLPEDRKNYLKGKRAEHGAFLDGLKTGDKVYLNGENSPAFGVVSASENGMTLEFYDADGEVVKVERVTPEAFTGDMAISLLDTAESTDVQSGQTGDAQGERANTILSSMGEAGKRTVEKYTKGLTGAAYADAVDRITQAYQKGAQGESVSYQTAEERTAYKAGQLDANRINKAKYNKDAGLKKNDTYQKMRANRTLTGRVARQINALGKVLGVQVELVEDLGGEGASGYYEDGVIRIAVQPNADPLTVTAIHEAVHRLRETDPAAYNMLAGAVETLMKENPEVFRELFAGKAELYGQVDENGEIKTGGIDYTQEEVTAQALGVVLSKTDMLEKLAARDRNGVQRLLDSVTDLLERIRQYTNGDYKLSEEDTEAFRDLEKHMADLQVLMERALENARANTQARTENQTQETEGTKGRASIKRSSNIPYEKQVGFFFGKNSSLSRSDDLAIPGPTQSDTRFMLSGKPFFMLKRNVAKSIRNKGSNENYSAHGIGEDVMNRVPGHISSPALIIVGNGRVSILGHEYVSTQRNEHAPLLIGIDPNSTVDGKPANEVKSIYGLDDLIGWLKARGADSTIYAGDIEKATALLRDAGLQLSGPVAYADDLTKQILALIDERSNTQNESGEQPRKYSFAGKKAKTADSKTLAQAEQMETEGRSNEEIRQETGWYRGMDGQWRFEIDDSGAKYHRGGDAQFRKDHPEYARYMELTDKMLDGSITDEEFAELRELATTWGAEQRRLQDMVNRGDVRLNMILDHDALFEAYPELRSAKVVFRDMEAGERGAYNPNTNTITLSNEVRSAAEDTLIHEVEHAIQAAEGFSGGASVEYWMNQGYSEEEAKRLYRNTAGEIEARDAAARRGMTAEERKNTPPDLGGENTVFADGSPVSFESRIDLEDMDIPWDPDNNSSIKDQLTRNLDKINSMNPAATVTYDKKSGKKYFEQLDDILRTRFGYKIDKQGFGTFLFDKNAIASIRHYVGSDAEAAAAIASPYVLKRGEIISGHRNHNNGRYPSVTFAAPVVLNGQTGIEAVTVLFADKNRVHSLRILAPDGSEFVLMAPNNETELEMAGVDARAPITQPTSSVSNDSIPDSSEKSNTQNDGKPAGKQSRKTTADEEQRRTHQTVADGLADGRFKGIDIMPGEGEEAVSSVNGFTDEERRGMDLTASLFGGETTAQKEERAATEKATKEGNAALAAFAEEMPDDPMDLYQQQNPVTNRRGGGDGGDGNNNRVQPGQEKISTAKEGERKTLREKISEAWHRFIRSMANEGDAIHQAGRKTGNRALDGMYFYAKAATTRAQQWIQGQRTSFDTTKSGKSLNDIFDPIRAKGDKYYEKFQLYLYHMLNVERMSRSTADVLQEAQRTVNRLAAVNTDIAAMTDETLAARARQYQEGGGLGFEDENGELIYEYWKAKQELRRAEKARNKPVFGWDGSDAEESRKTAQDLLADNPEFEELAQEVYDYVDDLLQYKVDAGLITAEDMVRLKKTYPHYVPVMYIVEEDALKNKKGNISVSTTVKSAKGGNHRIEPLHYALARQTLAVMKNAGYQQLGAEVLSEYEQNQEIMGQYVKNLEESDAVWDESLADNDDVAEPYENVISVFKDGKRYDLTLSDDMSFAFKSLQGKHGPQDWPLAMKGNNLFKKLCTAYNPLFLITNPIRDVQDALFYSTDTVKWLKNYPKAIAQIAGGGKLWQMYQSMGGVQNSYFDWATGENAGKMGKIEALNIAIEQAPRLAEFMTVLENAERKNGEVTQADRMEAFNAAAEITTNFSRGGTMGKWINRNLVPFWNPGVQGLSKAVRTVTETKGFKAWAGLAIKAAALGMLPELLNGLLYRDDDEWDTIDDQMKMEYYLFKTSDGVWIKVPKGRVLAALSMPVVGAQETLRGDEVDWGGLAAAAVGSVAPNNPLETNLLSTAVQAQLTDPNDPGKTWYGGNIESRRLQSYAPGERYDESTDRISKWLGGKLNISPKKLSYVIDQYSGVLGDLILPYLTPKAERGLYAGNVALPLSNAFMSRFTLDTVTSNTISSEYYGMLDELGYAAKGGDNPSKIAERYMNRAGGKVSDYYAKIREIENDPKLTDKEKTALTRELRKQLNEYEKEVTAEAGRYLSTAQELLGGHPEVDYTDDKAVEAWTEGYNSAQSSEKYYIDTDQAAEKMKDEAYREINREHFGAEYALQVYNKDVYAKAQSVNASSGLDYEDYYDYYFGTKDLYADKDENGKSISGSKKEKVVAYIDDMDITDEQKDALYLAAGYEEKTLKTAPWNGGSGIYSSGSKKSRGGGRRRRSGSKAVKVTSLPATSVTRAGGRSGASAAAVQTGSRSSKADATESLIDIVNKYYGGDMLAAAFDGGQRARSKIEFKL